MNKKYKTNDFNFKLPEDQIAQTPLEKRDESKLLCVEKKSQKVNHFKFKELQKLLNKNHLLVINNTKVRQARFWGYRESGGQVEILLLSPQTNTNWIALLNPSKRLKENETIIINLAAIHNS